MEWLKLSLGTNVPPEMTINLIGTFSEKTSYVTISLVVDYLGTEYRSVRLHKPISQIEPVTVKRLNRAYGNMIAYCQKNYVPKNYKAILEMFLKWCNNASYDAVLRPLVDSGHAKRIPAQKPVGDVR